MPPAIPPKGGNGDPPEFANQFLPRNDQLMLLFSKKLLLLVWYGTDVVTICPQQWLAANEQMRATIHEQAIRDIAEFSGSEFLHCTDL